MADKKPPVVTSAALQEILEEIFLELLKGTLADLKDRDRRTASVINAARAVLADNGINMDGLKALKEALEGQNNPAGEKLADLLANLPTFDEEADMPRH